jgi:hypothetical protein
VNTWARGSKPTTGSKRLFSVMVMFPPVIYILASIYSRWFYTVWKKMGFCLICVPLNTGYTVFMTVPSLNLLFSFFSNYFWALWLAPALYCTTYFLFSVCVCLCVCISTMYTDIIFAIRLHARIKIISNWIHGQAGTTTLSQPFLLITCHYNSFTY